MTAPAETETTAAAPMVRPIVVDILAARPELAYLMHPHPGLPVRPGTEADMEVIEDRARAEYAAFLEVPAVPEPHPPMCACNRKEPAPEPAAVTVADQPAADPGPIHCDCQDDPAPVLNPIAELALSRFEAAFAEDPEGEGDRAQPDVTAVMPVADAITTTTPAITEGSETS